MPRQHTGGDAGKAARASLLDRPSTTIRMPALTRAVLGVIAARRRVSVNHLVEEAISAWLPAQLSALTGGSHGT